jgi:ribosomal protein S18 acetylase RimI-like enzyme
MTIRDAVPGDAPALRDLIRQLGETDHPGPAATTESILAALGHPALGVLVVEDRGRPAGFLSYTVRPNLYHGAEAGHVDEFVVDRDARGPGLGTLLLTAFLRRMRARGCAEVSVGVLMGNEGGQRLYRAMRFTSDPVSLSGPATRR